MKPFLGIVANEDADKTQISALAERLKKPLFDSEQGFFSVSESSLALVHQNGQLILRHYGPGKLGDVFVDFDNADIRRRVQAGRKQPFARALGLHKRKSLSVLDATAGLARDSIVMAQLGCDVTLLERQAVVHALLEHALPHCPASLASQLNLLDCQDALAYMRARARQTEPLFDVVYLDPMYAQERRKALPKKSMQLVRELSGEDLDADELLAPALNIAARVVVKRAPHATDMANLTPSHRITGKTVRYDVYLSHQSKDSAHASS